MFCVNLNVWKGKNYKYVLRKWTTDLIKKLRKNKYIERGFK